MNRREFIAMTSMATLETHNLTCETARRAFEAQVVTEGIEKAQKNDGRFVYTSAMFDCRM